MKSIADHEWNPTKIIYMIIYGIVSAMKYLHENKIIHQHMPAILTINKI